MGCGCLFALLAVLSPRLAFLLLWIFTPLVTRAFDETWAMMEARSVTMRTASYGLAVQRVAEATVTRGIYP